MSFLSKYLEYCSNNECPEIYHLFSGLTVLAALTGRRIWFDQAYWRHYGNLYTVLVGIAGNGKSISAMTAGELLEDVDGVPTSSDCCSPRKLLEEMAENHRQFEYQGKKVDHSPLVALPDEISNFISQDAPLMIDTLTSVWYKKRHRYSTAHQGSFTVHGPSLTLLTCAVPEWIDSHLGADMITGGFSRRVLWIYAKGREKVVVPSKLIKTPRMLELWPQLVTHCRAVQNVIGEFKYDTGASEYFDKLYTEWKKKKRIDLAGYEESKPGFVIKIAMLLSLSDQMELLIKRCYIDEAVEILAKMEATFMKVFEGLGRNKLHPVLNNFLELVENFGSEGISVDRMRLLMSPKASMKEHDEITADLIKMKLIQIKSNCGNQVIVSTKYKDVLGGNNGKSEKALPNVATTTGQHGQDEISSKAMVS